MAVLILFKMNIHMKCNKNKTKFRINDRTVKCKLFKLKLFQKKYITNKISFHCCVQKLC